MCHFIRPPRHCSAHADVIAPAKQDRGVATTRGNYEPVQAQQLVSKGRGMTS